MKAPAERTGQEIAADQDGKASPLVVSLHVTNYQTECAKKDSSVPWHESTAASQGSAASAPETAIGQRAARCKSPHPPAPGVFFPQAPIAWGGQLTVLFSNPAAAEASGQRADQQSLCP